MTLREWLIVFGVVIIAGIVLDGIRRMRRARRDSMEMSIGMGGEIENTPLDEGFNPELPNGGARVASRSGDVDVRPEVGELEPARRETLEEPAVEVEPAVSVSGGRLEPSIGLSETDNVIFDEDNLSKVRVVSAAPAGNAGNEPFIKSDTQTQTQTQTTDPVMEAVSVTRGDSVAKATRKPMTFGEGLKATRVDRGQSSNRPAASKTDKEQASQSDQEVIVLNVMSRAGTVFTGAELKPLLEACGLVHGEMSIFHRHETSTDSPVQFSVANAVEPGVFPAALLETLETPGISFFMSLPGPEDNMRAFDYMVETAQCVVRNLAGEMKDERRSDMTPQTIEHCRQRIRDFERRQLTARC